MHTSAIVSSAAEAWRKYVSIGAIKPDLLRPHVLQAWVRSHEQGASAWVARAEMLSSSAMERLLDQQPRLLAAAYPYMHLLSKAAGAERHAMMLGTTDAIVLDVIGDEQSVSGPDRIPGPGSMLSEAVCGSNGISTPLVEGRYVEIVSTEHFTHGFQLFTCHGIPIETLEGERAGVLSAAVRRPETAERLHDVLVCAAHGIANDLARLQLADRVRDVMHAAELDCMPSDELQRMLVRLGALPPTPHPTMGEGGGRSSIQAATELLRVADEARRRLERRERAWRELAMSDRGMAARVELTDEVSDLLELLGPEIRGRRVELSYRPGGSEHAFADRRELRRIVFRQLLRGLDMAEAGGAMVVELRSEPPNTLCTLCVEQFRRRTATGS